MELGESGQYKVLLDSTEFTEEARAAIEGAALGDALKSQLLEARTYGGALQAIDGMRRPNSSFAMMTLKKGAEAQDIRLDANLYKEGAKDVARVIA